MNSKQVISGEALLELLIGHAKGQFTLNVYQWNKPLGTFLKLDNSDFYQAVMLADTMDVALMKCDHWDFGGINLHNIFVH